MELCLRSGSRLRFRGILRNSVQESRTVALSQKIWSVVRHLECGVRFIARERRRRRRCRGVTTARQAADREPIFELHSPERCCPANSCKRRAAEAQRKLSTHERARRSDITEINEHAGNGTSCARQGRSCRHRVVHR